MPDQRSLPLAGKDGLRHHRRHTYRIVRHAEIFPGSSQREE
jgi:hypothetical protein